MNFKNYPDLRFSAPEVANKETKASFESDYFSLMMVVYIIYKIRKEKSKTDSIYPLKSNIELYEK